MDINRRRSTQRPSNPNSTVVAAGSVWESRMKLDQVHGGFKVFNDNNNSEQESVSVGTRLKKLPQTVGKRKTWKSEPIQIAIKKTNPVQRPSSRSDPNPVRVRVGSGEDCTEIGVSEEELEEEKEKENEQEQEEEELEKVVCGDELERIEVEVEIKEIDQKEMKFEEVKREEKIVEANEKEKEKENVVLMSEVKRVSFERKFKSEIRNNEIKKLSPVMKRTANLPQADSKPTSTKFTSPSASHQRQSFPETHCRLQSFVDLVMWKDISRSVFIFGIGTFIIVSSSYTKDLNISFISVISYLGLVYLAAIFLFRSIICRGVIDMDYTDYVVGEEEAIWLLKLVLPYLNEFLLKLKALFSGDPATTMKLAALLFVLARCGSSITIWTMAKLGFFGVFTVPKVCSLYSTHITAYAKFWVRRFRDAWDSCSQKKGVTVAVFLLVWNLSSIIARIWAVFMLYVAFRYYQQNLVADDWAEDGGEEHGETWHEAIDDRKQPTIVDYTKQKKSS